HLSHDGDDNDFGLLVDRGETVVEDLEGGIVSGCAEGSHVEDVTDRHSAAVDAAMSFELATVEVVRRNSDKGSDLLAAHLTELWQESDQGEGQRRTHAAHRGQQSPFGARPKAIEILFGPGREIELPAPRQGHDEPGFLSYTIRPFCPTSADGL